jgi:beta-galactosidase
VADDQGRIVPVAMNSISFEVEGAGRILGVGNGDPSSHEADVMISGPAMRTRAVDGWHWKKISSENVTELPEEGAKFDETSWAEADVAGEHGPLGARERGVFRARFNVSAADLAAPAVELWFGKIEGEGVVYINGEKVGATGDSRAASVYDVKAMLHPGENTVAVGVTNWGVTAGPAKGVMLRMLDNPAPLQWQRSVFNGLAQILVKSSKAGGAIKLTARADGLKPASVTITANEVTPRLALP